MTNIKGQAAHTKTCCSFKDVTCDFKQHQKQKKTITIIGGLGVVGSALAKYLRVFGHDVMINDIKQDPAIDITLARQFEMSDFVFVCVPTPSNEDGSIDLFHVTKVTHELAVLAQKTKHLPRVVYKSTMVPGSTQKMEEIFESYGVKPLLAYNPEFLRQRFAFSDMMNPSRIVVGSPNEKFADELMDLFSETDCQKFMFLDFEHAEFVKYYANCYYAARISFFNQMKQYADLFGCDHDALVQAVVADGSVGIHGSNPTSQAWGGACIPKDMDAMLKLGEQMHVKSDCLLKSVKKINEQLKLGEAYADSSLDKWT